MDYIDLRSDTVTKPCPEMLRYMIEARCGDAGYDEDLESNSLEEYCAELFNKETALFFPSGTMSNQVALKSQCRPGNEVIIDKSYHINYFESASSINVAGVSLNTVETRNGIMEISDLENALKSKYRSVLYMNCP